MQWLLKACLSLATILALAQSSSAQEERPPDYKSKPLAEWIDILNDGKDSKMCVQAAQALGPKGPYAKQAVAAILTALKDKKPLSSDSAAFILGAYGPSVVPTLLEALKNPAIPVRAAAARAMGIVKPRPREAVLPLVECLKDSSPEVREATAYSLVELGRKASDAIPPLTAALHDKHAPVRRTAAYALSKMGRKSAPAIPGLIALLNDKDESVRKHAADALRELGPDAKAAVPKLIEALRDKNRASSEFVTALSGIGPAAKDAVPLLVEILQGDDEDMQGAAAFALGEIGPEAKSAVPVLLQLLGNEHYHRRSEVMQALGQIGPDAKAAVPLLIQALRTKTPHTFNFEAAWALGGIGSNAKPAVPALIAIARDQLADVNAREAAAKAVMEIDPTLAAKEGMETAYLSIRLGKTPAIKPMPRPALPEEQKRKIKALIAELAQVEHADFGLSARLAGHAFAPIPGQGHMSVGLLPTHEVKPSTTFRELVELGPDALPFLLDALEDKTPTKLKVDWSFAMVKGFSWDLYGNPLNRSEQQVLTKPFARADDDDGNDDVPDSYTVKVADVCFVAIGQIVGREYLAVRYVPTGCVVVNSPIERTVLRDRVRELWSSKDPAKSLMDSLLLDYATEGIFNGKSLDGWHEGSEYQIQAAMRLLYYFPKEAEPIITARLKSLNVRPAKNNDGWMLNDVKNGVYTIDFLKAVSWCKLPAIQEALADIAKRTDDPYIKAAATVGKSKTSEKP